MTEHLLLGPAIRLPVQHALQCGRSGSNGREVQPLVSRTVPIPAALQQYHVCNSCRCPICMHMAVTTRLRCPCMETLGPSADREERAAVTLGLCLACTDLVAGRLIVRTAATDLARLPHGTGFLSAR